MLKQNKVHESAPRLETLQEPRKLVELSSQQRGGPRPTALSVLGSFAALLDFSVAASCHN